ncbi:MAG TPA: cytochrome C oxidase subunit IV family protein [candidate division Zixibacteria bacterium]|nr:cytochrome C oxidase subunit IV family protein [candidate division Zixibacteria bacterium]
MSQNNHEHNHVLPLKVYMGVATALLVLTIITVVVAQFHFGEFNLIIAMAVAAVKATLVALYFMHLRYDSRMYAIVFVGSLMFLAVFIGFTMLDTMRRGDIYKEVAHPLHDAKIYHEPRPAGESTHSAIDTTHTTEKPAPAGH